MKKILFIIIATFTVLSGFSQDFDGKKGETNGILLNAPENTILMNPPKGINLQDAEMVDDIGLMALKGFESFETADVAGTRVYALTFPVNSGGLRHCIERATELLYDNAVDYRKPVNVSEMMPEGSDLNNINIANIYDLNHQMKFDELNEALADENSENGVYREWSLKHDWQVQMILTFAGYQILISKK